MTSSTVRSPWQLVARCFALGCTGLALFFLFNNYLNYWLDWPGILRFVEHQSGGDTSAGLAPEQATQGWVQLGLLLLVCLGVIGFVLGTRHRPLRTEADQLAALAAFLCRSGFWAVLLIGFVDGAISFLRVEGLLEGLFGDDLARELGRAIFRGSYLHYPLVVVGGLIAWRLRGLGFVWLALLVVVAEFLIVLCRFVFSYEQAFMGDLVRMWYAALFLFASAHALVTEGHVRVDVLYARFPARRKALSNAIGTVLLGLPLCWTILLVGMQSKGSSINSPLRSFEISQQGFGMYVKYLMVGYLVIFALSMLIQFCSYFLQSVAELLEEPSPEPEP
jgi:TRAP-type mannitol/chloroaromatic compound transport system permease small subunit